MLNFIVINLLIIHSSIYLLHYLSHKRYNTILCKYLYNYHHKHHVIYTPVKFIKYNYTKSHMNKHIIINYIFSPESYVIVTIWIIIYNLTNYDYLINFIIENFIYLFSIEYLHTQYHTKNSILDKYKLFRYFKKLHYIHHQQPLYYLNIIPIFEIIYYKFKYEYLNLITLKSVND